MSPVRYLCQRCGNCCRWPGLVRLEPDECGPIAEFLGLTESQFHDACTRLRPSRTGLMLASREDGTCIFLEGRNTCRIQPVKPRQCRDFPNGWNFPGWREMCEAKEIAGEEG